MAIVADLSAQHRGKVDLDDRLALEQRAEYLTFNDPVTDLPNRQRFESLLLDTMANAAFYYGALRALVERRSVLSAASASGASGRPESIWPRWKRCRKRATA